MRAALGDTSEDNDGKKGVCLVLSSFSLSSLCSVSILPVLFMNVYSN